MRLLTETVADKATTMIRKTVDVRGVGLAIWLPLLHLRLAMFLSFRDSHGWMHMSRRYLELKMNHLRGSALRYIIRVYFKRRFP